MNQMSFVAPEPRPAAVPMAFSGGRGEFRRLVSRGAGLELITAGFYRFWLATDIRRHLWSYTSLDGDAFEYTGRARDLLIGFLFALAILVPIYVVYFLVGLEAERLQAFASIPLFLFFYLFGQFAIYRARRYRLTRTVWRGVRFWMAGSGLGYAGRAALWGLLMALTLGLALPWREAALERYKMRHTYYGDLQASFEGNGWEFFKAGWWLWLLAPVALMVFPLAPFVYGAFKAVEWRWWLSGIRFGGLSLTSTLRRSALIGLYWKVIGWMILIGLVFAAYLFASATLAARISGVPFDHLFGKQMSIESIPFLALTVVGYLAYVLAINVVIRVYLLRDLWVRLLVSVDVQGLQAVDNVAARGELSNALGEGFADGLDVAGF